MTASRTSLDHLTAPERRGASQALREIEDHLGAGARVVEIYGAAGSLGAALAARLVARAGAGPILYVVARRRGRRRERARRPLSFFLPPAATRSDDPLAPPPALQLPAPDPSPYAEMQPDRRALLGRMAALFRLSRGFAPRVLVASAPALFRRVVPRAPFDELCWTIRAGEALDRDQTIAALVRAGFSRASVVEDPGTFAVRGAVIDVFPPVYKHPVRVELFGDEVEALRLYDAATQRNAAPARPSCTSHPVRDTIRTAGADPRAKILGGRRRLPSSPLVEDPPYILDQIDEGESFFGIEALAPAFHARMETVFDYLPSDALLVVEDPEAVVEAARRHASKLRETAQSSRAEHRLALDALRVRCSSRTRRAPALSRARTWRPRGQARRGRRLRARRRPRAARAPRRGAEHRACAAELPAGARRAERANVSTPRTPTPRRSR